MQRPITGPIMVFPKVRDHVKALVPSSKPFFEEIDDPPSMIFFMQSAEDGWATIINSV